MCKAVPLGWQLHLHLKVSVYIIFHSQNIREAVLTLLSFAINEIPLSLPSWSHVF